MEKWRLFHTFEFSSNPIEVDSLATSAIRLRGEIGRKDKSGKQFIQNWQPTTVLRRFIKQLNIGDSSYQPTINFWLKAGAKWTAEHVLGENRLLQAFNLPIYRLRRIPAVEPIILKVALSTMVALLKLSAILLCLASVSAIEKALLDKFAQAAVNGINNDKDSGDKLFAVLVFSNVKETGQGVTFDLIAVQTLCPKETKQKPSDCDTDVHSPILKHKVVATKKPDGVYSVASTGPMVPDPKETIDTLPLEARQ
ncbi:hypothetical protein M514_23282 [Trichuris suis]|uniref:Cystatin domain-containing protein n=1 Tax=Trichuris suis TaxID=68888 RepID=A0A085N522_9BILA|nr:hypothetical protein M514_23282 [Trichuris suis]